MSSRSRSRLADPSARLRLVVSMTAGVAVGVLVALFGQGLYGLLLGWMTAAAVFVAWMWATMRPMDAPATREHACREDPGQAISDLVVLGAAIASLAAVAFFIVGGSSGGSNKDMVALLSVCSVGLAWGAAHTVFTARYARLYYGGSAGGVDFNHEDAPRYLDFAYLAFTVGMTFQVSDTDITRQEMRDMVLRHMLLSYLLGAVVIATTINLVAGLAH